MYSELKPNMLQSQELARQKLVQTIKDNPKLSMQACWEKTRQENPKLFGDLQAADWMEDDKAEEQETHGAFQPSNQARHQFSLPDYFPKPKQRIECKGYENENGSLTIQGAFSNPL
jgi:hypothetical protein